MTSTLFLRRTCAPLLAAVVLVVTAPAATWLDLSAAGGPVIDPLGAPAAPDVAVLASDHQALSVAVVTPGLTLDLAGRSAGDFVVLGWPDASIAGEVGAPALPVVRRLFVVPAGASLSLNYDAGPAMPLDAAALGSRLVLPVQPPIEKLPGAIEGAVFRFDPLAYGIDADLPAERVTVEELGLVRGQRVFLLEVRPVAYNAAAGTLTLYPRITVDLDFVGGRETDAALSPLPGLRRIVLNPDQVPTASDRGSGNYLIVTAPAYATQIAPFAAFKQSQGYTVSTWTAPAGSTSTAIKTYIQGLWNTPAAPDYILLVGDTDTIPAWTGGGAGSPQTDLPYACMDGSADWFPDIAIGRFPARTAAQLDAMLAKTLYYEEASFADPDYLMRSVWMASNDNYTVSEGTHNWCINTYMIPLGYSYDKLYCHTYNATTQQVRNAFNNGRFFGIYSGHGGNTSWADGPSFTQSDVNGLTNVNMYPMICSFACVTGSFTDVECFMETWVRAPSKGAVTAWGSSVNSYWTEDDVLQRRLFDVIFDDQDPVPSDLGPIYNETKMRYLAQMGNNSTTRRYFEMYNLMGDPALWVVQSPVAPTGLRVTPGTSLTATGQAYGPFHPNSITYTLENQGDTAFDYAVTKTAPWVLLSNTGGTLQPLETTTVTVSIGPAANVLGNGTYTDTVQFTNLATGQGNATRTVTLKIGVPVLIYAWNMDTNPGWTISGGLWAWGTPTGGGGAYGCKDPNSGHTGTKVYGYNLSGDYTNSMPEYHLTTTPIDCSMLTGVKLKFWRWLGVESPTYDHAYVRASNNGSTYTTIWSNDGQIADGAWVPVEYDLSAIADGKPGLTVRWTMGTTDSSWTFCGWNIDDVEIWGIPPTPPAPCAGDMDCDGSVTFDDIDLFVAALGYPNGLGWPSVCAWLHGDCTGDGDVTFDDIDPFVARIGSTCP